MASVRLQIISKPRGYVQPAGEERRVVFRGAVLECPRCRLSGWYVIDRVGEVWRCDGCQEDFPIPLEPEKTEWHYRINELYAQGHNQGTLTPC
jgi:hypothetical protein